MFLDATFPELFVATAFGIWGLFSLLIYVPSVGSVLRFLDRFYLLPEWRFFAPMPGQSDFHLLYRDWFDEEHTTEWTEITCVAPRSQWCFVWNPKKRANKSILDIVIELAREAKNNDGQVLVITTSYLNLLNFVSSLDRSSSPMYVQFLLMQSFGGSEQKQPEFMFTSGRHRLC